MLLIECPWCGARDEHEFSYGGEAHIARPLDPSKLSDEAWADYLFMRTNPRGKHRERWMHAHGCRRWFNMERDTVTHEISAIYLMHEKPAKALSIAAAERMPKRAQGKREGPA